MKLYRMLSRRTLLAGDVPGVCGGGARLSGGHVLQHLPLDAGPPPHRFVAIVAERIVINPGVAGSISANSPVQKYGKLVTRIQYSVFVQLAKRVVINIFFTLTPAGFLSSTP
jgi:hypothetical protein